MGYKDKIQLKRTNQCYELDSKYQYKLCDYYISSSFMTPCVGNQHYDYVSNDMIIQVIQSGARYIQIPICESDVGLNAFPVVGTTEYGQRVITSLNTLDLRQVLNSIRANAFNINNNKINYPLIIHFILNTKNTYTLNIIADTVQEIISDKLSKPSNYKKFPIFLEKLCNLLGQIILIATPEYQGTKLEEYIIPTNILYESYQFSELPALSNPTDTVFTNQYNNKLSMKQQTKSNNIFKIKYPSLDYVINNSSTIGQTIMNDNDILNNLTNFNKVGMTLIKPHYTTDITSTNYDPAEAIFNGCQLVSMNFQINDDNMKNYLKIFKNSSFIAKPASMRFSEKEEPIADLLEVYKAISPSDSKVDNSIYHNYNNLLIAFESYTASGLYVTQIENNLRFTIGSVITRDKNGNKNYKVGLEQCFLISKSTISMGTSDVPMFLTSPSYNKLISQNGNFFDLENLKNIKSDIYTQSFVFENSQVKDADDDNLYLVRTIKLQNPMYLAFENRMLKAYAYSGFAEAQNNMSFRIHIIPFNFIIKIFTLYDGSVKTMDSSNIVGVLENNTKDATGYILEAAFPNNSNNFNYLKDQFYMKNPQKNTYLIYDNDTKFIYDKPGLPGSNGIFNIKLSNGFFSIFNNTGETLSLFQNNLLKFTNTQDIDPNANLFKINTSYILTN
jgi:hypothetical protein